MTDHPIFLDNSDQGKFLHSRVRVWIITQFADLNKTILYDYNIMKSYQTWTEHAPETGTLHRHYWLIFHKAVYGTKVKKLFEEQLNIEVHVAPSKKKFDQRQAYIVKDPARGECISFGELNQDQGYRSDLKSAADAIASGANLEELAVSFPELIMKYPNGIKMLLSIQKKPITPPKNVIWIYGNSGLGKTFRHFNPDPNKCYLKNPMTEWWNGYKGQETVIIDDLRPDSKISRGHLIQLLDVYGTKVDVKFGVLENFSTSTVVITCPYSPWDMYPTPDPNEINQIVRRLTEIWNVTSEEAYDWQNAKWEKIK